jgi:hypothetical protein
MQRGVEKPRNGQTTHVGIGQFVPECTLLSQTKHLDDPFLLVPVNVLVGIYYVRLKHLEDKKSDPEDYHTVMYKIPTCSD